MIVKKIEIILFLLFWLLLPFLMSAQDLSWEELAEKLCEKNSKAVIAFDCPDTYIHVLKQQPEFDKNVFVESTFDSQLGKAMGMNKKIAALYLLDKNMQLLDKGAGTRVTWKRFKPILAQSASKECHLIASLPTQFSWDTNPPELQSPPQSYTPVTESSKMVRGNKVRVDESKVSTPDDKPDKEHVPNLVAALAAEPKQSMSSNQPTLQSAQFFSVQVGLYEKKENAERKASQDRDGMSANIKGEYVPYLGKTAYFVTYDGFTSKEQAKSFAKKYHGFVRTWQ